MKAAKREFTETNRSQPEKTCTSALTYVLIMHIEASIHLSFSCITLSFHISLIPLQRLSDLDCSRTDPQNSTANKHHGAEKEGGLLTSHRGTSYHTKYHQHAIIEQASSFKHKMLVVQR